MALSVTQANTISQKVFGKDYKNNVYDSIPFLKMLRSKHKIKVRGGTQITFPLEYKQLGTAASRDWGEEVVYESVDTWTQGVLSWAHIDAQALISKEERFKNQGGPQQTVDIIKAKEKALRADLASQLATQLMATATATNKIIPLSTIVDSADSYAGIAVADASVWAGIEDSSQTTMTRAFMYGRVAAASYDNSQPTVHYTTRALLASYNALLGADERYTNTKTANAGFNTITLYGDNVYADGYVPANYWFGLDIDCFELHVMEGVDGTPSAWFELEQAGHPKALAKYVDWAGNLVASRRRTSFKCSALTGT